MNEVKLETGCDKYMNDLLILPKDLAISTVVVTCKTNFDFNTQNIGLYFDNYDDILIEKHYLKVCYKKNSSVEMKNKKNKKNFRNQVTFIFDTNKLMNVKNTIDKIISIKIFENGSLQITGCKEIINIKKCMLILFDKIKTPKIINENGIEREIYFIDDEKMLKLNNISKFNICMINTTFKFDYNLNLNNLYDELKLNGITDISYDPSDKVYMLISHKIDNNVISVFIFESGKVNISTNNITHNYETYYFINKFIFERATKILIKPITIKLLDDIINECQKELNINC